MRIAHVTTSMHGGGVTSMLRAVIGGLSSQGFDNTVICLREGPMIADELRALGASVIELGLGRSQISPTAFLKTRDALRRLQPDVIQGWMYHGNALASLAGNRAPVLWGIHHTLTSMAQEKPLTRILIRSGRALSIWTRRIIYCSSVSGAQHEALGYPKQKSVVIPNGFSPEAFRFDGHARARLRDHLGIPRSAFVFGSASRFHPMKNHTGLIAAFGDLDCPAGIAPWLVLCGRGMSWDNAEIAEAIRAAGVEDRVRLLSHVDDMAAFFSVFDAYVSASSWGEAFPMVLGEAMLCERLCVTTDVGDSGTIVGHAGVIIPPKNPAALVAALGRVFHSPSAERKRLGRAARDRVERNYSIQRIVAAYADEYRAAVQAPSRPVSRAEWKSNSA